MDHPVRYGITMGEAYSDSEFQDFCHLDEKQVGQIMPQFRDGGNDFHDKVGRIETLCPWKYMFYDENGRATIPAAPTYTVSRPQRLRDPDAPREQKPMPKSKDTNVKLAPQETTPKPTWAQVAKQALPPRDRKTPSLTPDDSSEDSSGSNPTTPEPTATLGGGVTQKSAISNVRLSC